MSDICIAPCSKFHDGPDFFRITSLPECSHNDHNHPKKARTVICHFADGHTERYGSTIQATEYTGASASMIYNAISRKRRGGPGWCHAENGDFWPELVDKKQEKE